MHKEAFHSYRFVSRVVAFRRMILAVAVFAFSPTKVCAVSSSDFKASVIGLSVVDFHGNYDGYENRTETLTAEFSSPQSPLIVPYGKTLLVKVSYSFPDDYGAPIWVLADTWSSGRHEPAGHNPSTWYRGNGIAYGFINLSNNSYTNDITLETMVVLTATSSTSSGNRTEWIICTAPVNVVFKKPDVFVFFDDSGSHMMGEVSPVDTIQGFTIGKPEKLCPNPFWCSGCVFQGWATSLERAARGIVDYIDEQEIAVYSDMTLYAVWAEPELILEAESADWANGSITLRFADADTSGAAHSYWFGCVDENDGAVTIGENVSVGADGIAHLTDVGFSTRFDGITPVRYFIVDENDRWSECVTRNRYGLFVGLSDYDADEFPPSELDRIVSPVNDATKMRDLFVVDGGMVNENAKLLLNANATLSGLESAVADFSKRTIPGDLFFLYVATHGSYKNGKARVCLYDKSYRMDQLISQLDAFDKSVAVLPVLMACHSGAFVDYATGNAELEDKSRGFALFVSEGLAMCRANMPVIASCGACEFSVNAGTYSDFGEAFIVEGWSNGHADGPLSGVGYSGGNGDGFVSFLELARYAQCFAIGYSDAVRSSTRWTEEHETMLSRLKAGRVPATATLCSAAPLAPTSLVATKGERDNGIALSWSSVPTASRYWVYRLKNGASGEKDEDWEGIAYRTVNTAGIDKSVHVSEVRSYRVRAVNPVGVSSWSPSDSGYRGTDGLVSFLVNAASSLLLSGTTTELAEKPSANGLTLEQCYVAGISPTNAAARFEARIEFDAAGKPVVKWTPDLNENGTKDERVYRVLGAKALGASASWDDVTDLADPDAAGYRFFKAAVALPE